ncbi:MAG TPA: AAA family ATPase [Hyphomicrobium sp.]|nr:AAA family ATPase [Hyphomicrobium sp.]
MIDAYLKSIRKDDPDKINLTIFKDHWGKKAESRPYTLEQLAILVKNTTAESKDALPLLKLARFGDQRTRAGCLRHNPNVISINGVEIDYDGGELLPQIAARRLTKAGLKALVYTSPSHSFEEPRWRVICPTSTALPAAEHKRLVAKVCAILGCSVDGGSYDLSRSYYFGQTRGGEPIETYITKGQPVDLLPPEAHGGDEPEPPEAHGGDKLGVTLEQARAMLADLPDWLEARVTWFKAMCAIHHEFDGSLQARAMFDAWSRSHLSNYSARDLRRDWGSLEVDKPNGITLRTINAELEQRGSPAHVSELAGLFDDLPADESELLPCWSPDECLAVEDAPYVIKGLVAARNVITLVGDPGVGKSVLAPYLAYSVARGSPVFGMRTRAGRVLYLACENEGDLRKRVGALRRRHGSTANLLVVGNASGNLDPKSRYWRALMQKIADWQPDLIVVDTLAAASPAFNENDGESMAREVKKYRSLTRAGAAVILVHHTAKSTDGTPRGFSGLHGDVDANLYLKRGESGVVVGSCTKNRNGPSHLPCLSYRNEVISLGLDPEGDERTTVICEPVDIFEVGEPLTPNEATALDVLREIGGHHEVVSIDTWREACRDLDPKPKSFRVRWSRVLQGLQAKRRVRVNKARGRVVIDDLEI